METNANKGLKEFYHKYNLCNDAFAPIAGVGVGTLVKYAQGKTIREDARLRIEKAMRVAEKYNLVRPEDARRASIYGDRHNYGSKAWCYEWEFKQLITGFEE